MRQAIQQRSGQPFVAGEDLRAVGEGQIRRHHQTRRLVALAGLIFHRQHGMAFLKGYGVFRSAFESSEPLTSEQAQIVWDYLTDQTIDYWVFERMKERHPDRTEQVFRQILKDQQFQLERDFEPTLRKFKGQQMRRPPRPTVTVMDDEAVRQLIQSEMCS